MLINTLLYRFSYGHKNIFKKKFVPNNKKQQLLLQMIQQQNNHENTSSKIQTILLLTIDKALQQNKDGRKQKIKLEENERFQKMVNEGLMMHDYLNKRTKFIEIYNEEIKYDFGHLKSHRTTNGLIAAKRILSLLQKRHPNQCKLFIYQLDPLTQLIPSYNTLVPNPISLHTIKQKLVNFSYPSFNNFLHQVTKMINDMNLVCIKNKNMLDKIRKFRECFYQCMFQVIQKKSYMNHPLYYDIQTLQYEKMDQQQEIRMLKLRVEVKNDYQQYLDYDPNYQFTDSEQILQYNSNLSTSQINPNGKKSSKSSKTKPVKVQKTKLVKLQQIKIQQKNKKIKVFNQSMLKDLAKKIKQLIRIDGNDLPELYKLLASKQNHSDKSKEQDLLDFEKLQYEDLIQIQEKANSMYRYYQIKLETQKQQKQQILQQLINYQFSDSSQSIT